MANTLPVYTATIDDAFTTTWYNMRNEMIDNILSSTVTWLMLKEFGVLTPEVGGQLVTRGVRFGTKSTQRIQKGSVLSQTEPEINTQAQWDWRYTAVDVNRSIISDAVNAGPHKLRSYVEDRLMVARDAISQDIETDLHRWSAYYSGIPTWNGLYDICPFSAAETAVGSGAASDTNAAGTSNGKINRTNSWWQNKVKTGTAGASLYLLPEMRTFYNTIGNNQENINVVLCDQTLYEYYEDEVSDRVQIVRTGFDKKAADLGFETLTFKGAPMFWTEKLASSLHMFMLNTNYIEYVFNPDLWFDMTEWMTTPNQLERVAYILNMTTGLITNQPRRHGIMEYAS